MLYLYNFSKMLNKIFLLNQNNQNTSLLIFFSYFDINAFNKSIEFFL